MGVSARPSLVPPLPWRTIGILVILGLLVIAGALVFAGSRQRLPEPFGPARNGSIVYSTSAGDIHSVDPVTGVSHGIVTGSAIDGGTVLSRDGTRFLFVRTGDGVTNALFVANVDGSGVRQLFEGQFALSSLVDGVRQLDPPPFSWSPDGAHVAVISTVDFIPKVTIVATDESGAAKTLELGMSTSDVSFRPNGRELVLKGVKSETSGATYGLYVVDVDGTGLHAILPANDLQFGWRAPSLSPDGTLVAFSRWGSPKTSENGIHVLGVDTGVDRVVEFAGYLDADEFMPQFSPDGKQIVFQRYVSDGYHLVVAPVTGGGQPVAIGPLQPAAAADPFLTFSPDGTLILATYPADGSTWLLGSDGVKQQQMAWPKGQFLSWQRLAP
jgi:Tol biopolymer transport system component